MEQWSNGACSNAPLIGGWARCALLRSGGGGADPVAAGPLAAEEALREAGIAAGEDAHEVDVEGADGAVLLGDLGEGTGKLVDVVGAVCLAYINEAALLLHDAGRLAHALRQGPALYPLGVGGGHPLRHLVEEVVQALLALARADLLP